MRGNIKTFAGYLTISLAVLGAASARPASGAGGFESDDGRNGGDVRISRGHTDGSAGGDSGDGVGDARTGESGAVARPKTIVPGAGKPGDASGMGARPGVNTLNRSFGSLVYSPAPVVSFSQAGGNNGGPGLRGAVYGQGTPAPDAGAAPISDTNVAPEGVYNQFGFGVTAAAVNSANPLNRSVHVNRPNLIDADAYNSQLANGPYGLLGYYGTFGGYRGNGANENGYSPFLYDSSLYDRHGSSYSNSNYDYTGYGPGAFEYRSLTALVAQPAVYEYSHPRTAPVAPPKPAVADQAATGFDAARDAFKAGDYSRALELTEQSIKPMPNDAALQEFRGLVLFALRRYEDAAAPLHAALSIGPGWDWQTLIGLYPNVSVYTEQLRALEHYCNLNRRSASARFVLAFLYMTQGNPEVAVEQFKQVIAFQRQDAVVARLIQQLEKTTSPAGPGGVRLQ